ncbi:thioredoxin domain-containing protein [uncultured Desulfosarcina sp.]|uniref:DsbA family protein n=1 Tax=uncultured Desulfosarcina sp. TaxID=218289 RepID=UPI0029C7D7F8|nr:thioredoxin domain-containing protein [uncultured Desulfosarcina sp.]
MLKRAKWIIAVMLILAPAGLQAAFEYESILKDDVGGAVLDVAADPDADLVFLLTPEAVLIYSIKDKAVLDRIILDERFDRIAYQPDDRLVLTAADPDRTHLFRRLTQFLGLTAANPSRINIVQFSRIFAIDLTGRAVKGPKDAGVTLVVFDDYQCPYCARLERFSHQLLEIYPDDLNYAIKHFPLSSHPLANQGAAAALAAGNQGKFWEFHSLLLENHDQLSEEKITEIATGLNLDMEKFNRDRASEPIRKIIAEDVANGQQVGVTGTPSVFMNGKRIENRQIGNLPALIQQELEKKAKP